MPMSVVSVRCTVALAAFVALDVTPPTLVQGAAPLDDHRTVEIRRIQSHFDSVLTELPGRDLSTLTSAPRARRSALLATLRAYRDRGEFPRNYDFPGQAIPYFVDRETGTLCAVAHLLASTGRRDIVDRVARLDNNILVPELAGDTAFTAWLDANGLTLTEAARIQVPYMSDQSPIVSALGSRNATYAVGSALAIGGSIVTSLWSTRGNADGHRGLANIVGFVTGATTLALGAAALGDNSAPAAVGPLSLIAGGVTTYLSTRGFLRHRLFVSAERETARSSGVARAVISPILPVAGSNGAGVSVRLSF